MTCAGHPQAGEDKAWCSGHEQWHWPDGVIPNTIELFHDAMDDHDGPYHDRDTGIVDGTSGEIVRALLAAGWRAPKSD